MTVDGLKIDAASRAVWVKEEFVRLRNKEFELLEYFLENVGRVISRSELLEGVWDQNIFCVTNTVDVHVSTLRKKLRSCDFARRIETIHCVGYLLRS